MTALLVLEAIQEGKLAPETPITASAAAAQIPEGSSTANIKAGEVLTVEQLLYCLLLPSANEAAPDPGGRRWMGTRRLSWST